MTAAAVIRLRQTGAPAAPPRARAKEVSTLTIEILERPILAESGYWKGV
jgi:hypothetical protein